MPLRYENLTSQGPRRVDTVDHWMRLDFSGTILGPVQDFVLMFDPDDTPPPTWQTYGFAALTINFPNIQGQEIVAPPVRIIQHDSPGQSVNFTQLDSRMFDRLRNSAGYLPDVMNILVSIHRWVGPGEISVWGLVP